MNPEFEAEMGRTLQAATQQAVNVTAEAHHDQGAQDVEGRLRQELESRGINVTDDEWLGELADNIRESRVVIIGNPDEIGSDAEEV